MCLWLVGLTCNILATTPDSSTNNANFDYLVKHTLYLNISFSIGYATLSALPEDVTLWRDTPRNEPKNIGRLAQNWLNNVKAGPVTDNDNFFFNWIGHPIQGADYYLIARKKGFSRWQSFAYSAFASTVLWEYGWEAIAEIPSKQDLVITPVVGSLLGELYFNWGQTIKANNYKVWGSKAWGKTLMFAMNPMGIFSEQFIPKSQRKNFSSSTSINSDSLNGTQVKWQFNLTF